MILTRTPYRVSLFGGGTDYPEYFLHHGEGACLGFAIDKYCYVGVKHMPPGQQLSMGVPAHYRVQYSRVEDRGSVEEIRHPAIRGVLQYFGVSDDLEFHCFGDMPGRAGLGGSGAFTVGLVHAMRRLFPNAGPQKDFLPLEIPRNLSQFDPLYLAAEATFVEQKVIKEAVGCQDQLLCALGGIRLLQFTEQTRWHGPPLPIDNNRLEELLASLILVYSGTMRDAHAMAAEQIKEIPGKVTVLRMMARMAHIGADILNSNDKLHIIGGMLDEAWHLKCRLCPQVSNNEIYTLYRRGKQEGAIGGKLLGAGGGGFMLFFVPPGKRAQFAREIGMPSATFGISDRGTSVVVDETEEGR